jgi:hypothetical protein
MADLAVSRPSESQRLAGVAADGRGGEHRDPPPEQKRKWRQPDSPELAIALGGAVTAVFEEGPDGQPMIRIIDRERGETVALVTPEELRAMTAGTGLPPGLLMRATS